MTEEKATAKEYAYGNVRVNLPNALKLSKKAGKLTTAQLRRLSYPKQGIARLCEEVAAIMETNPDFIVKGVTPDGLRQAAVEAEAADVLMVELETVLQSIKQQHWLNVDAAYELVRRVNDQMHAQVKYDPQLKEKFGPLVEYFSRTKKAEPPKEEKA